MLGRGGQDPGLGGQDPGVGVGIQGRAAAEWSAKNPEGLTSKAADLPLKWGEGKALIVLLALLCTAAEMREYGEMEICVLGIYIIRAIVMELLPRFLNILTHLILITTHE